MVILALIGVAGMIGIGMYETVGGAGLTEIPVFLLGSARFLFRLSLTSESFSFIIA